jgi:N utilization substance protein B
LIAVFVVVGIVGYRSLGVDKFPKVDFPMVMIVTPYPGASPGAVETDVTQKIEEAVNTVSGLNTLTSFSTEGVSLVLAQFELEIDPQAQLFAKELVAAASTRTSEIDELITASSKNWRLDRMSRVDRNILRLGACELLAFRDVPVKVVINEAVELAKRFGTAESSAFVNGVLDRIATAVGRSAED